MPHWSVMSFTVIFSKGFTDNRFSNTLMITSFVNAAMSCRSFCVQSVNLNFLLYVRAADMAIDNLDFVILVTQTPRLTAGAAAELVLHIRQQAELFPYLMQIGVSHQTAVYLTGYFSSLSDRPYNQ